MLLSETAIHQDLLVIEVKYEHVETIPLRLLDCSLINVILIG